MTSIFFLRHGVALGVLAMLGTAAAAQDVSAGPAAAASAAANEADAGEAIIVTGSRIRRDPLAQDSPVIVLDSAAIERTGLSAIADVLQRLPSAAGGLNTKVNNSGNIGNPQDGGGVGAGSAEIDLRYLLAKRTLVLVDGLRYVSGASASGIPSTVDLNTIPNSSISRIEVLQSGQSPLYGSDAIAGVVNIITKASQEGLQASAQYGKFRAGDGGTQNYDVSYGVKGPTTSIVFGGSYVKQNAVRTRDRASSQFPSPGLMTCDVPNSPCSSATLNGFIALGRDFNGDGVSDVLTVKAPVNGRPRFNPADPIGPTSDFKILTPADRFNFSPFNYFLTPSERYGAFVSFRQELGSDVNLRVKAVYNRRNSQNQAAFLPLFIGPDAGNGNVLDMVSIDVTNPFNPFGVTLSPGGAGNPPANYSTVRRRLIEAGQRTYTQHVDTMSVTGTLDGKFQVGERTFYWDANAVLGFNDAHQTFTGNVNAANIQRALGPVAQCTAPCVPLNIFGGAGSITPAMLAYISFIERDRSRQRLQDYTLNVSGDLFDPFGAGMVGIAAGYEHRDQYGNFIPDPIIQAGLGADIPAQAAFGRFNTDEVYGELRVPILKDVPFFRQLEADGSVRYASYSTGVSSTTFTGTGLWKPIDDLLLRGSYAEGFRAGSIGELFGAQSRTDAPVIDPCTNLVIPGTPTYATDATIRMNCIANGVPANGSYRENSGQVSTLNGGNPGLKPERSTTYLFGAVYSPAWARASGFASQFSVEANYYDVRVSGAIAAIGPQVTLGRCTQLGDPLACGNVIRTPNGLIARIVGTLQNIGQIRTKGIDLTVTYRSPPTGVGLFGLSLNGNNLRSYRETSATAAGSSTISYRGTTRGSPDQSYPKFKGTGVIDWQLGDFFAAFTGRYIDSVTEAAGKLDDTFYGDVRVEVSPGFMDRRFTFTIGVNNVFNQDPPPCFSCTGPNYDPTTYDVPGQFGYLRVAYKM